MGKVGRYQNPTCRECEKEELWLLRHGRPDYRLGTCGEHWYLSRVTERSPGLRSHFHYRHGEESSPPLVYTTAARSAEEWSSAHG